MELFRRRPPVWALILLPVLLWLGQYWQRGLWAPDEARYAYVAREMRETGEWLVMHVNGELYPDKPPLLFWLINAASVIFTGGEINGVAARLPSMLGMILALWAVARLAERWADAGTAWRTVLVTMTSFMIWQEGGWGRIDALLLGLVMTAVYQLFMFSDDGRRLRPLAAYGLLGLAMLAKGPVALPVALGIYTAGTLAVGEGGKLRRWHWAWGLVLACAIPAAWLATARWYAHGPDGYFNLMFGVKSFGRVVKDVAHPQPFWYFLAHFPAEFLPWTIFLPAAYVALGAGSLRRRLLAWGLFILVMFSLFSGKRQMYVLAAYPAAAMMIAAAWPRFAGLSRRWSGITGWAAMGLVLLIGVVATAAAVVLNLAPADGKLGLKIAAFTADLGEVHLSWRLLVVGVPMLAGGGWLVWTFRRERLSQRWFAGFAGLNFANLALIGAVVLPVANPLKAPLALIPEVQQRLAPGHPIYLYGRQLAIVPLYLERQGQELHTPEEVEAVLAREKSGMIVFMAEKWEKLQPRFAGRLVTRPVKMGGKRLVWAEFPVPKEPSKAGGDAAPVAKDSVPVKAAGK
jgi:4-amino-4-deoxy-L-arabinose transferase-like glycosyltransferase